MKITSIFPVIAGAFLMASGTAALAQDTSAGQQIYMDRCAVCHGDAGKGDGIVAELFDRKPTNLTQLAKENGGEFPFDRVYQSIDGRLQIPGHGLEHMPIWGEYFMEQAIADRAINPKDARIIAEGRILAVVYYIQSLQED